MSTRSPSRTDALERAQRIGKAIADIGRLRILAVLRDRELCVCHLVDLLELDPSTVSRHVKALREAGLVSVRKEGRWLHCRRSESSGLVGAAIDELVAGAPEVERDLARLDASSGDCEESCGPNC